MRDTRLGAKPEEVPALPAAVQKGAPSRVALAAAFEAFEGAAIQVRGVYEWIERLTRRRTLRDDEAARLWTFAEQTRQLADAVHEDADRLAKILLRQFVSQDGGWELSPAEERDLHEVLAALAKRDAERHASRTEEPAAERDSD